MDGISRAALRVLRSASAGFVVVGDPGVTEAVLLELVTRRLVVRSGRLSRLVRLRDALQAAGFNAPPMRGLSAGADVYVVNRRSSEARAIVDGGGAR